MRAFRAMTVLILLMTAGPARAQDAEPEPPAEEPSEEESSPEADADPDPDPEPDPEPEPNPEPARAPKVAIIVVGDPDDTLRAAARRVDGALEPTLRRPFDPGLRASLRGEPGESDDGLSEVRRDRRRLGLGEASDAPILARLGRRAGAVVVGAVRAGEDGAELVILDVAQAAFYEGALSLHDRPAADRIAAFVARRARASASGTELSPEAVADAAPADEPEPADEEEEDEPDFFEQYWPYGVAALLLAGMIAAIIAANEADQPSTPVLRFVPGGE